MNNLEPIVERIRQNLEAKNQAREQGLTLSREIIRASANAIRALHRHEFEAARGLLQSAQTAVVTCEAVLRDHPDVYYAGFVHDAQKEFAEACITYAIVRGEPLPEPEALGVSYIAYLHGMGEAVGELRRHLLDYLRHGDVSRCEALLEAMDDLYTVLVTLDYPDAMTAGLRRTTDAARGILEKTRGDLTLAIRQRDLERELQRFEEWLRRAAVAGAKESPE